MHMYVHEFFPLFHSSAIVYHCLKSTSLYPYPTLTMLLWFTRVVSHQGIGINWWSATEALSCLLIYPAHSSKIVLPPGPAYVEKKVVRKRSMLHEGRGAAPEKCCIMGQGDEGKKKADKASYRFLVHEDLSLFVYRMCNSQHLSNALS